MRYTRISLAALTAATAAVLGVTTALAAITWTVRPGGSVTAVSGQVVIKDVPTGSLFECPTSTLKAALKNGSGLPGTNIGSVSAFTFPPLKPMAKACMGPLSITFKLTMTHLPMTLNATSYSANTGTTTGMITGIHATVVGPSCEMVFDGTAASKDNGSLQVSYVNSTHKLTYLPGGNLHEYKVTGCGFLPGFANGHKVTITGAGKLTPAQTITSP
jgi:hypothetical protein